MGFFDKSSNKQEAPSPAAPSAAAKAGGSSSKTTFLAKNAVVEGITRVKGNMTVAGQVVGELFSEGHIIVEPTGVIEAKIQCRSINIQGVVRGNIEASDQITIESTGKLTGDIVAKVFSNQPGGFFEGYSHMLDDGPPKNGNAKSETAEKTKK